MYCRRKLDPEYESMSDDIKPFREIFLGGIMGIVLRERGANDPHIVFQIIHEDDGHWFLSTNGASTSWLKDYQEVLKEVEEWCDKNCFPDIVFGCQYGWRFKPKKEK